MLSNCPNVTGCGIKQQGNVQWHHRVASPPGNRFQFINDTLKASIIGILPGQLATLANQGRIMPAHTHAPYGVGKLRRSARKLDDTFVSRMLGKSFNRDRDNRQATGHVLEGLERKRIADPRILNERDDANRRPVHLAAEILGGHRAEDSYVLQLAQPARSRGFHAPANETQLVVWQQQGNRMKEIIVQARIHRSLVDHHAPPLRRKGVGWVAQSRKELKVTTVRRDQGRPLIPAVPADLTQDKLSYRNDQVKLPGQASDGLGHNWSGAHCRRRREVVFSGMIDTKRPRHSGNQVVVVY